MLEILKARLVARVLDEDALARRFHDALERVEKTQLDPYAAAEELLGQVR